MTPLITANQLEEIINSGENVLLCDCRFDLVDIHRQVKKHMKRITFLAPFMSISITICPAIKRAPTVDILYPPQKHGRKLKLA